MYRWRKFEFFEEKAAGHGDGGGGSSSTAVVPAEIAGRVTCCSGGRGRVALGCDDGTVGLLDRGFRLSYGFQAHASSVLFLQQLKGALMAKKGKMACFFDAWSAAGGQEHMLNSGA